MSSLTNPFIMIFTKSRRKGSTNASMKFMEEGWMKWERALSKVIFFWMEKEWQCISTRRTLIGKRPNKQVASAILFIKVSPTINSIGQAPGLLLAMKIQINIQEHGLWRSKKKKKIRMSHRDLINVIKYFLFYERMHDQLDLIVDWLPLMRVKSRYGCFSWRCSK